MRIFKYKSFSSWVKAEKLTDAALLDAVNEITAGLFEANLGGELYKKRVARKGQGKSGGYRTLIAYKEGDKVIFMYGFAKNERDNISHKEKEIYKRLAKYYLHATTAQLNTLISDGELIEVKQCQN